MEKKWIFPKAVPFGETITEGIHPLVQELLFRRGIQTTEEQLEFVAEKPRMTYDPFLMKDMRAAAEALLKAIDEDKKICVYGDYDADGICSVSLVMEILSLLQADAFYYIPSRFKEGYGLNISAIETVKNQGAELLLTVDCGSVSKKEVEYAKQLGLKVIVTDHHTMGEPAAQCLLVNPKQKECSYPDQALCGCGLAFKLAQALSRLDKGGENGTSRIGKAELNHVLDLAAIATIGDIVPLLGENRTIVKYGMRILNRGTRPGIYTLVSDAELPFGELNAEHVAYVIVPHLNAAGRLASAETGVRLLTAQEDSERKEASRDLVSYNRERRSLQEDTFQSVAKTVDAMEEIPPLLMLETPGAHEGITGIVAGKIKDRYYRPVVILTPSDEIYLKGTGRSIPGVDLYEILASGSELYERFGGHEGACGFLIRRDRFAQLQERLMNTAANMLSADPELFVPKLSVDMVLTPEDVTEDLIKNLERLAPFGQSNPKPILCFQGVVPARLVTMGDRGQHLRFQLGNLECVFFGGTEQYEAVLSSGLRVDVAGYPGINCWRGKKTIQMVISDIKLTE